MITQICNAICCSTNICRRISKMPNTSLLHVFTTRKQDIRDLKNPIYSRGSELSHELNDSASSKKQNTTKQAIRVFS